MHATPQFCGQPLFEILPVDLRVKDDSYAENILDVAELPVLDPRIRLAEYLLPKAVDIIYPIAQLIFVVTLPEKTLKQIAYRHAVLLVEAQL